MRYRPEIDGLRTLAVVPVVLYHAAIGPFEGGFAGVDVFFVISGYLITTILIDDLEAGTFSIARFYERRARRILPALFVVSFCSTIIAWLILFPTEFNEFGQSLVATAMFLSNVFFWLKSDYFATAAELKPLLHTWSLAVEEQFYIVFPFFLAATWTGAAAWFRTLGWLAGLGSASFFLCLWIGNGWNAIAFYMLPFRAWELLIGAIVAVVLERCAVEPRRLPAYLGFVMLGTSLAVPSEGVWPSALTLLPTLGTALIILYAQSDRGVGRFLSWPPMVWGGLISYSLYLWHQPVLSFARHLSLDELSVQMRLCLVGLSVLLAALSWYFVEQVFRARKSRTGISQRTVFVLSAAAIGIAVAAGGSIDQKDGWPDRQTLSGVSFAKIETQLMGSRPDILACSTELVLRDPPVRPREDCIFPPADGNEFGKTAILIGDSHADMLSGLMRDLITDRGYKLTVATFRGCMPFPGFRTRQRPCDEANQQTYDWIATENYDLIVVAFRLPSWDSIESHVTLADPTGVTATQDNFPPLIDAALRRLLANAEDVVIITPVPDMPKEIWPYIRKRAVFDATPAELAIWADYSELRDHYAALRAILDQLDSENLWVVDGLAIFCDESVGICPGIENGQALYFDDNHLTAAGVAKIKPQIIRALDLLQDDKR